MYPDRRPAPVPLNRPLYLIYGNDAEAMNRARDGLLASILPKELRGENLTEFMPPGGRNYPWGYELERAIPEIASDFDMLSFLEGAPRVAIVVNPVEIYGAMARGPRAGKKKKKKDEAAEDGNPRWLEWIERELPKTGNKLILIAHEDEAEGREINDKDAVFQTIAKLGHIEPCREGKKAFFRIEETLAARDAAGCLAAIRDLWKPGKGDQAAYAAVVRAMRFMLQGNIVRERRIGMTGEDEALYFPKRSQFSLAKAHDFVQKRHTRSNAYRTPALLDAYQKLLGVYRALRPQPGELFVPDAQALLERILMELFASPPPGR